MPARRLTLVASQRDQDMKRRQTGPAKKRPWWLVAVVLTLAVGALALWPQAPAPATRDANFAAFGLADDPFMGDPEAPLVLVGYESPHCSSCQYFHNNILPTLDQEFFSTGKVVFYYIQGTIGDDFESSVAQECSYQAGGNAAFWDLTQLLYARSNTYTAPDWDTWLGDLADRQGLDHQALLDCFHGQETGSKVSADLRVGRDHDARGTPSFWLFGATGEAQKVSPFSELEGRLREASS